MTVKQTLLTLGLLGATSVAFANPIPLPPGLIQLSDNNAEELINADGSAPGDTTVDVGDRLRGIFDIGTIEGLNPFSPVVGPSFGGNQLTGVFDVVVLSKTGSVAGGGFTWTFGASGNLGTAGAAIEMYSDDSFNYTRLGCPDTATCEATATDGDLWAAFGLGATSFWSAAGLTDDISVIGGLTPPAIGGTFNIGLDFLVNNTGYEYNKLECLFPGSGLAADVCASGSLLGTGGVDTPYDSFSNIDFSLNRVPEPATLLLFGLGLAGLGMSRRKKA